MLNHYRLYRLWNKFGPRPLNAQEWRLFLTDSAPWQNAAGHGRGRAEETVWRKLIRLHLNTLVACDFFTKEVITPLDVRATCRLPLIHIGTRKVFLTPPTYHPHEQCVQQQVRYVMMWLGDQLLEARFLIHDWGSKFSTAFRALFGSVGVRPLRTPKLAPDANSVAFVECLLWAFDFDSIHVFQQGGRDGTRPRSG